MDNLVRPMQTGVRNGMPASGGYVYGGTGEDIMPWADSGDGTVYDPEDLGMSPAPSPPRGGRVARQRVPRGRNTCAKCGYGYRTRAHRQLCGTPAVSRAR